MMHKKNFVTAIKVGGKVLRESSDRVELPFGSEYAVMIKNLDTVRMQAQISIDGKQIGGWLVLNPGEYYDVERFFANDRDKGNKLKFIERTAKIEQHRGIDAEDGLVRVEFKREKVYVPDKVTHHYHYDHYNHSWPYHGPCFNFNSMPVTLTSNNLTRSSGISGQTVTGIHNAGGASGGIISANMMSVSQQNLNMSSATNPQNDAGITVEGGLSNQRFISVAGFECEASEAIVLHLVGSKAGSKIKVAKTVDLKPVCNTCGTKNKSGVKFCKECGTSLEKF